MRRLSAILLVSALLAACGGSSSEFTAGGSIALDQLPDELARALCQAEQACSPFFYQVAFSNADCAGVLSAQLEQATFAQIRIAIDEKQVNYDGLKARSCVSAVASGGCAVLDNDLPTVCHEALSGTVASGGDCDIDAECSGLARCQISGGTCPGTCAPLASAGVACTRNDDCARGLTCSAVTSRCAAPAAEGEACQGGSAEQCAAGLLCIGNSEEKKLTGTCQSPAKALTKQAGESCSVDAGPWCAPGLACVVESASPVSYQCHTTAAPGGTCGIAIPSECPTGQYCPLALSDLLLGKLTANCVALPGSGEACGPAIAVTRCAGDLVCDDTTAPAQPVCIERRALGQSCSSDALCTSVHCVGNACVPASVCAK
ncbi:MAG: hypothetical protein ABW061_22725 [Polyangiaceae bacterium]